jgi:hypothetical protein
MESLIGQIIIFYDKGHPCAFVGGNDPVITNLLGAFDIDASTMAAMNDIDAVPLDFLKSYSEDEGEGILPKFAGSLKPPPVFAPDQVESARVTPDAAMMKPRRKRRSPKVPWKKPKGMPKRPLSAYNIFFQKERERMIQTGAGKKAASAKSSPVADPVISSGANKRSQDGKGRAHVKSTGIGFANLAKTIAAKWRQIDPQARAEFETLAAAEKARYNKEMVVWRTKQKVEKEIEEKTESLDIELGLQQRRSSLMTASPSMSTPRPTFMRRLSDPYPDTSHQLELYRHRQHMFNSSYTRACLAQMMQGTYFEPTIEPLNLPSLNSSLDAAIDGELENTFQEEPSDALRTFSDSFLDDQHLYDIRPCEDIIADVAMRNEQKQLPALATQSSLMALGSTLDDDTVDFLTHLKYEV